MKDLTFTSLYHNTETREVDISYGGKHILKIYVNSKDVCEIKAACLAVQTEILKDVIQLCKITTP